MGIIKIIISILFIGWAESIVVKANPDITMRDRNLFDIAMCILFGSWIISGAW